MFARNANAHPARLPILPPPVRKDGDRDKDGYVSPTRGKAGRGNVPPTGGNTRRGNVTGVRGFEIPVKLAPHGVVPRYVMIFLYFVFR